MRTFVLLFLLLLSVFGFGATSVAPGRNATALSDSDDAGQFTCLCSVRVAEFRLIDSVTDEELFTLEEAMTIDIASPNLLSGGKLNVRAVIDPDDHTVEDVRVRTIQIVDGNEIVVNEHTERYPTYAVQYNSVDGTDYDDWEPETDAGRNVYRFEAEGLLDAAGTQVTETKSVTVAFCKNCYNRVSGWRVIDVQSREEADNAVNPPSPFVVDLAARRYSSMQVNIRAIMDVEGASAPGPEMTSVVFTLNGEFLRREVVPPYALFGESSPGEYLAWTPTLNTDYAFCATSYHAGATTTPPGPGVVNRQFLPGPTDCVTIHFCSGCTEGPERFVIVDPKQVRAGDELFTIGDGAEIDWGAFSQTQGNPVNVRCVMLPNDEAWDHVDMYLDGQHIRREFVSPYALFGDSTPFHYYDNYRPLLNDDRVILRVGCEGVKADGTRSERKSVTFTLCRSGNCSPSALMPNTVSSAALVSNDGSEAGPSSAKGGADNDAASWVNLQTGAAAGAGVAFAAIVAVMAMVVRRRSRPVGHSVPAPPVAPSHRRSQSGGGSVPGYMQRRRSLSGISKRDLEEICVAEQQL